MLTCFCIQSLKNIVFADHTTLDKTKAVSDRVNLRAACCSILIRMRSN